MPARQAVVAGALLLAPLAPMAQVPVPPDPLAQMPAPPATLAQLPAPPDQAVPETPLHPDGGPAAQLSITTFRSLNFGRFVAGSGGSLTVSPGGARSRSGGVVLMNSGGSASAGFNVGTLNGSGATKSVILSLPADGEVFLSNGASTMAVRNFVSSAGTLISLTPAGIAVNVGATLVVGAGQQRGPYSGSFQLIVNYQ